MTESEAHRRLGRPKRTELEQARRDMAGMAVEHLRDVADMRRSIPRLIEEARIKHEREQGEWSELGVTRSQAAQKPSLSELQAEISMLWLTREKSRIEGILEQEAERRRIKGQYAREAAARR